MLENFKLNVGGEEAHHPETTEKHEIIVVEFAGWSETLQVMFRANTNTTHVMWVSGSGSILKQIRLDGFDPLTVRAIAMEWAGVPAEVTEEESA